MIAAGHDPDRLAGYTLDRVSVLIQGLDAEELRRDRDRLFLLRAAQADSDSWRRIWQALSED